MREARGLQPVSLFATGATTDTGDDVHLYFLAGQSNMVGLGNGSALSAELTARLQALSRPGDPTAPITYYAATHAGGASTSYSRASCVMNSERDQRVLDRKSPDFQKVERLPFAPVTSCHWENVIYDLPSRFGPELSFGLALHEHWPDQQFVLSKRAVCGASLAQDWTPGKHSSGYGALMADLVEVRRAFSPRRVVPAGLIWVQGEADSTVESQAKAYQANLISFISHLREDMDDPKLPVVLVGLSGPPLSAPRKYQHYVEKAFKDAELGLPNVVYLRNDVDRSSRDHLPIGKEGGMARRGETEFPKMLGELNEAGELDRSLDIHQRRDLRGNGCAHYSARAQIRIGARAAASLANMNGQAPARWPWVQGADGHHTWRTGPATERRQGGSNRRWNSTRARVLRAEAAKVRAAPPLHLEAAAEQPVTNDRRAADKRAHDERRAAGRGASSTERATIPDGGAVADDADVDGGRAVADDADVNGGAVADDGAVADEVAAASLSIPKATCRGVTDYMNSWCEANCAVGFCPPDKCACEDDSAPAAVPVVNKTAVADDAPAPDTTGAAAIAAATAVADAGAASAAAIAAASGLGSLGLPVDETQETPDKNLRDWFWEMEERLLQHLPDESSIDSKHACRAA